LSEQAVQSAKDAQRQIITSQQQAKAAQESVRVIRRQMQVDQRPWIEIAPNFEGQNISNRIVENQALNIPIRFTNGLPTTGKAAIGMVPGSNNSLSLTTSLLK
jgi:hypothetical protein